MKNKKKKWPVDEDGMVYSTGAGFWQDEIDEEAEEILLPQQQHLKLRLDKKQRKGKIVTLVEGFVGPDSELKKLEKELKTLCGVGGTAKNGTILIQGNFLDKIKQHLTGKGYRVK